MDDHRATTVETYNRSAEALAEYFKGIGPRVRDIDKALELAGNPINPSIVEIGCGDGRDAAYIVTRTNRYTGFDISRGMIKIAKKTVPNTHFEVGDAVSYEYPKGADIVFAFASLLHLDKDEVGSVFNKVYESLNPGGIFYISTKYAPEYTELIKKDQYGERLFYLYNSSLIKQLAGEGYATVFENKDTRGNTEWLEIAFQKT